MTDSIARGKKKIEKVDCIYLNKAPLLNIRDIKKEASFRARGLSGLDSINICLLRDAVIYQVNYLS